MKIALIRKEYRELQGGAERYAVALAHGLAGRGHRVHVFAGEWDADAHGPVSLHRVPFIRRPSPVKNFSFQYNVGRYVQPGDFDIVNGLSQVYPQDVYRAGDGIHRHWLKIQTPDPRKRLFRYVSPRHMVILAIERRIFNPRNFRRIITNSLLCKKQIMYYFGVPDEKIQVVYNGVSSNRFNTDSRDRVREAVRRRLGAGAGETVLLFAGHNFKRKGLQFALQCALGLRERGHRVKLMAAGRGNPGPFMRIARKRDFAGGLIFTGPVDRIRELYCAADILVHPTMYDPFSNVCLEAMACGLPVITTRLNGASEIIRHRDSGVVLEVPWDMEAMVSETGLLLEDGPERLRLMGCRARGIARQFSMEKNVSETLAVYEKVLQEKGGR